MGGVGGGRVGGGGAVAGTWAGTGHSAAQRQSARTANQRVVVGCERLRVRIFIRSPSLPLVRCSDQASRAEPPPRPPRCSQLCPRPCPCALPCLSARSPLPPRRALPPHLHRHPHACIPFHFIPPLSDSLSFPFPFPFPPLSALLSL